jgi:hypothetical protein
MIVWSVYGVSKDTLVDLFDDKLITNAMMVSDELLPILHGISHDTLILIN